ncbi:uncharacterized protein LOC130220846 [Danio aesculapii]|uniref:uncharacterized protein LOC130220846 n=1 Tax=Danio aesculapii TaxID=1142201 RepID=UPI0024BFBB9A|nr:uncharacterized protein LOC130220846 [Danio aesculapii]
MHPPYCFLLSILLMVADGFSVHGPSAPLSAPLGSSVVLPCYVDKALPVEDLEVEWRRADSETLIHLYQDGESRPEVQQQDYHDRAHFFTEEIQHGNFSLRLDNLTAQDEGEYRCTVHSQQDSGETVVHMKDVERLLVSGSDESISAYVGEDVTLNCSVDSHITPEHIKVSWKKTDKDGDILVLLFQNNETLPDSSHERFRGRVEFFTAEIPKGNFSLRLKSARTEDKGVYMCQVFAGGASANATIELERLGFSAVNIIMMILCVSASGSALLLCFMIYCRSPTKGFFVEEPLNIFFNMGSSVVLPCHVDRHIFKKIQKVEWRRKNTKTLVHLYQDGESQVQKQHEDYHDRAHFFAEEIQHGNFSLCLDNLRAEDAGEYTCTVYRNWFAVTRAAEIKLAPWFIVNGSSDPQTVLLGDSVVLHCQVDTYLLQRNVKVEWTRSDSETLVHLYQDGESRPKKQNKEYRNRAHFIVEEIKNGNFSLRLDNLRAEDEGEYTCTVYSDQNYVYSTEANIELLDFDVQCSHHTLAPLGSSVVLPCYVDEALPVEDLEVEWRRADSETLVHLYQDGESRAEVQQQDYHDRAHFFTEEIQHGNFSLRLDNLTAQDEGEYTCTIYRNQTPVFSVKRNLVLRLLDHVLRLQMILVFCPNILMFVAFILWGVSEGSLFESVSCCALYFLRPLMLLWAAPYVTEFTGNIKTFMESYTFRAEYVVFSAVFYSVLFKSAFDKGLSYAGFEGVMIIVLFVIVLLFNLIYIIYLLDTIFKKLSQRINTIFDVLAGISLDVLPSLQFILLFFAFGSARGGFFIVAVLPVFITVTNYDWDLVCGERMGCLPSVRRSVWLILMLLINAVMVYFYIIALENEKDRVGWACMIAFLQLLWAVMNFTWSFKWILHRVVPVYVFGSVAVVLLNSVTLMTELILKTVNGEGAVGDLRIVVFSSEFVFTLLLMILLVFEPWIKTCLQSCQSAAGSDEHPASEPNQNTAEAHEMETLLKIEDQESDMKPKEQTWKCVVLYNFTPVEHFLLDLVVGETIEILAKGENGSWMGKKNNQVGLFSANYVKELEGASVDAAGSDETLASASIASIQSLNMLYQETTESHEINLQLHQDQENGRSHVTEENQPDL